MDVKSMSRSKRSHTQQHQPRKPHHPSKPSSSNPSTTTSKNDGKQKKRTPPPPSLPSNWGRYEDEEEEVAEVPIDSNSDEPSRFADSKKRVDDDVVKPRSKGADYSSLIAEAKEARSYCTPSFDDRLPDFCEGAAQMLGVKGEKIFLQDIDDDFLMEDEAIGTREAPFLTLDLKDLAERLSKVHLAKRLFIESDLLPPELHGQDASEADDQAPFKMPGRKIERIDSFGELLALYLEEERMAKEQDDLDGILFSSNHSSHHDSEPNIESKADVTVSKLDDLEFLDARESVRIDHFSEKDAKDKSYDVDQINCATNSTKEVTTNIREGFEFLDERKNPMFSHVTEQETRSISKFQAASAEAELDMLLGSFNETKLFDTPMNQPVFSASPTTGNIVSHGAPLQPPLDQYAPAFPITTSLDDELDDLLAGTASLNNKDGLSQSTLVPSSSLSQPGSKSKVLEDFDSWLDTL